MEGFNLYGSSISEMGAGTQWAALDGVLTIDPQDGVSDYCLLIDDSGASNLIGSRATLPTPGNAIGVAFRWRVNQLPNNGGQLPSVTFVDSGANKQYGLMLNTSGRLQFGFTTDQQYTIETVVETTASQVIFANTWYHIEMFVDVTTGVYEVRVEGTTVLSGTDSSGSRPTSDMYGVMFTKRSNGATSSITEHTAYIKDLILWDDLGSENNDFVGTVSVFTLMVDEDISSGWTASSGLDQYALLDEASVNDSDYITADDTPPAAAVFGCEDLPADIVSIKAVQPIARLFKSDAGDATVQMAAISAGDSDTGPDRDWETV
jgi:hypothetical protein